MAQPPVFGSHSIRWPDPVAGPWLLTFHWGEVAGVAECVGLDVRSFQEVRRDETKREFKTPGNGSLSVISAELWRSLPVGRLIAEEAATAKDIRRWIASGQAPKTRARAKRLAAEQAGRFAEGPRRGPRMHWTRERLEEVAATYRLALSQTRKHAPTQAVGDAFGVSPSMAGKLVRRARDEGLLGETSQGRAGGAQVKPPRRPGGKR